MAAFIGEQADVIAVWRRMSASRRVAPARPNVSLVLSWRVTLEMGLGERREMTGRGRSPCPPGDAVLR
jgi:hypothetical protein